MKTLGVKESMVSRTFALHGADAGLIPSTTRFPKTLP